MNEKYLILERDIRHDLEVLGGIWDELAEASLRAEAEPDHVIATGQNNSAIEAAQAEV